MGNTCVRCQEHKKMEDDADKINIVAISSAEVFSLNHKLGGNPQNERGETRQNLCDYKILEFKKILGIKNSFFKLVNCR